MEHAITDRRTMVAAMQRHAVIPDHDIVGCPDVTIEMTLKRAVLIRPLSVRMNVLGHNIFQDFEMASIQGHLHC